MIGLYDYQELMIFSAFLSVVMVMVSRFVSDQKKIKKLRKDIKLYREKADKALKSGNREESQRFISEMNKASIKQLEYSSKSMFLSLIIFVIALRLFSPAYSDLLVSLPFPMPYIGWGFPFIHLTLEYNWFWWYTLVFLTTSVTMRKFFDVV